MRASGASLDPHVSIRPLSPEIGRLLAPPAQGEYWYARPSQGSLRIRTMTLQSNPRTIVQALTATSKLIWAQSDSFARRQLAYSFALLLVASLLSALYPVLYKLTIDAFSGHADPTMLIAPGLLIAGLVLCNYSLGL